MRLPDPLYLRIEKLYEKDVISFDEAKRLCVQLTSEKAIPYIKEGLSVDKAFELARDEVTGKEQYVRFFA